MDAHPAAELFPMMSAQEYAGLLEDIRQHGLREPIIVDSKTKTILDGRNRYRACRESQTVPEFEWYDGDDPTGYVVSLNLHRRHLNESQRAMIAARLANAGEGRPSVTASIDAVTQPEAAKLLNVSRPSVQRARVVLNDGTPELIAAVDAGKVTVSKAAKHAKAAKELQALKAAPVELPPSCIIEVADIYDGLPGVADCTVDAIITDPPYGEQALPLYKALGAVASRVLKPGAPCIVLTGQMHLPAVLQALTETLEYRWTLAYLTPGGQSPQIWPHKVNTFWKPLLWLAKAPAGQMAEWRGDVIKTPVNDNDKRFHGWGQNITGFADIVVRFTHQQDVILDPFVGGGTTGAAAVAQNRSFIGFDSDPASVNIARARIGGINA